MKSGEKNGFVPLYALTLLSSAFLLFSVQPMFGKMVLPVLGGTPAVWNTAMLFFQSVLLLGYAYAHITSRFLSVRSQAILHLVLLCVFLGVLPIALPEDWLPDYEKSPLLWQLGVMALTVGGPFAVLSGTAPMLQRWFAETGHARAGNPYFLYAASNAGSLAGLLLYPFLIEPTLVLPSQAQWWALLYVVSILLIGGCALLFHLENQSSQSSKDPEPKTPVETVPLSRKLSWLGLAFIPSSAMLGVTTYITTDIAAMPLFWVLPLALYVGSFMIAFSERPLIPRKQAILLHGGFLLTLLILHLAIPMFNLWTYTSLCMHLLVFGALALSCHHELNALRPHASRLTEFYLIVALGGVLGGVFNTILAPLLFTNPVEYTLALAASVFARYMSEPGQDFQAWISYLRKNKEKFTLGWFFKSDIWLTVGIPLVFVAGFLLTHELMFRIMTGCILVLFFVYVDTRWVFGLFTALLLLAFPFSFTSGDLVFAQRNFYGTLRIADDTEGKIRSLSHGTTLHGFQSLDERYQTRVTSYYGPQSGVAEIFDFYGGEEGDRAVAVFGLGTGTLACFSAPGRHFDFFEINPAVVWIARDSGYFTYLEKCGSPYEIFMGDARLTIRSRPDNLYDMIFLDAFTSDNIPVHLLTMEAVQIYLQKLKPDGVLVFHISNRHMNLEPVLARIGEEVGLTALSVVSPDGTEEQSGLAYHAAQYVILSRNASLLDFLSRKKWTPAFRRESVGLWTDRYTNILSVLGRKPKIPASEKAHPHKPSQTE